VEELFMLHGAASIEKFLKISQQEFIYGSKERDNFLLHDPSTFPRYGHLARLAFIHYGGANYQPDSISEFHESCIRSGIKKIIRDKVIFKGQYDWEWIDNALKAAISDILKIDLIYDSALVENGPRRAFTEKTIRTDFSMGDTCH
jgi:hypothetical protein